MFILDIGLKLNNIYFAAMFVCTSLITESFSAEELSLNSQKILTRRKKKTRKRMYEAKNIKKPGKTPKKKMYSNATFGCQVFGKCTYQTCLHLKQRFT